MREDADILHPPAGLQIWKLPVFIWVSLNHLDVQRKAKVFSFKGMFLKLTLNFSLQIFKERKWWLLEADSVQKPKEAV